MVPVKKKHSDEIRITVIFSRLNVKTKDIAFPMTNPTTLLGKVAGEEMGFICKHETKFFSR